MDPHPALDLDAPIEAARQRAAELWREAAPDASPPAMLEAPGNDAAAAHAAVKVLHAQLQEPPAVASQPRLTRLLLLHDAAELDALTHGRPVSAHVTAQAQEPGESVRARLTTSGPDRGEAVAVSEEHWAACCAALPTSTVYSLDL